MQIICKCLSGCSTPAFPWDAFGSSRGPRPVDRFHTLSPDVGHPGRGTHTRQGPWGSGYSTYGPRPSHGTPVGQVGVTGLWIRLPHFHATWSRHGAPKAGHTHQAGPLGLRVFNLRPAALPWDACGSSRGPRTMDTFPIYIGV